MLAAEVIALGTAIVSFATAIAGTSACVHFTSVNNKTNIAVLKDKVHALENLIQVLQQKVTGTAEVVPDPTPWIGKAQIFLSKLNVKELEEKLYYTCVNGLLPNCPMRWAARNLIGAKVETLDELIEDGQRIQRVSIVRGYRQLSKEANIVGSSRIEAKDKIWKQVSTAKEGTLCIHGTVGVGKTFIAAAVHDIALKKPELFDSVIWVTITHGADLFQVQDDIASSLKIELPKTSHSSERARVLKNTLVGTKKFLLILDSMCEALRLEDIGVPELGEGRKLIITSRLRNICSKITHGKEWEQIKPLHFDESWELFQREVGSTVLSGLEPETISCTKTAVSELDGLPLAIKMLAEILSETETSSWADQLAYLRASPTYLGGRDQELFDNFRSVYRNLSKETKSCFLHSALFPKNHPIENKELIEHWMWEGLISDYNDTLEKGMRKGKESLRELVNSHLLEVVVEEGRKDRVMILNLVRSMAIDTMLNNADDDEQCKHRVFVKSGDSLVSMPKEKEWPSKVEKASFIKNQLTALDLKKNSKNYEWLSTLLLQDNPLNSVSHPKFFYSMRNLKVLNLSRTKISILPNSLAQLTNLHALLLRTCPNLRKLPDLSKLQQLIVLDLSGTPLTHCPQGIHYMKKLRRLDLSQSNLKPIPAGVVSELADLEELLLITDTDEAGFIWRSKVLDERWSGACIEELVGLDKLAVLELNFLNADVFNMFVKKAEVLKFRFYVGGFRIGRPVAENSVTAVGEHSLTLPRKTSELYMTMCSEEITMLTLKGCFKDLNVLDVSSFSDLRYLISVKTLGSLKNLRRICVRNCKKMSMLFVQTDAEHNPSAIAHLELITIVLYNLPNLGSICRGHVLNFPELRSIEVWSCENLKLPMILTRGFELIQVSGEKCWIDNLEFDNSSNPLLQDSNQSHSNFKFTATTMPPELAETDRVRMNNLRGVSGGNAPDVLQTHDTSTNNAMPPTSPIQPESPNGEDDDNNGTGAASEDSALETILNFGQNLVKQFATLLSNTRSSMFLRTRSSMLSGTRSSVSSSKRKKLASRSSIVTFR